LANHGISVKFCQLFTNLLDPPSRHQLPFDASALLSIDPEPLDFARGLEHGERLSRRAAFFLVGPPSRS
jgi:hypothetical protein